MSEAPKCGHCKSPSRWLPDFREMVTQTVEEWVYTEDDAYQVLRDRTYPITYSVSECTNPECGKLFLYDLLGGLGDITREDYEKRLKSGVQW